MATTYTPNADLALMGTGDEVDNWGVVQNNAIFTPLDGILGASLPVTMTTTDVTLTLSQWQSMSFIITGVLTGNLNLFFPISPSDSGGGTLAVGGTRIIDNQTTGNFTITVKTAAVGSTGVVAPQGYRCVIASDTVNVNFSQNVMPLAIVQSSVASATVSSDQNDYAIAAVVAYERLNVTTNAVLSGITNGVAGRILTLYNTGTAILTFAPNSALSTSGNRFLINKPIYLRPNSGLSLQYDGTSLAWRPQNLLQADPPSGLFTNLAIKVATNTTVNVTANNVVMTDGQYFLPTGALSAPLNLGSSGSVNQLDTGSIASASWYYVFAISNGVTMGTLASLSATAPTLPSGYTFFARIGALRTAAGVAQLMGTSQLGRTVQYVVGLAQTTVVPNIAAGVAGTWSATSPTLATASITGVVPATASKIRIIATTAYAGAGTAALLVAPSTSYGGTNNGPSGSNGMLWPISLNAADGATAAAAQTAMAEFLLETTTIAWAADRSGGAIACMGWEDNL